MALGTTEEPHSRFGVGGMLPLALAVTAILVGAVAIVAWLASSGPLLPPPVTVRIPVVFPAPAAASPEDAAKAPPIAAGPRPFPDPALLENTSNGPLPIVDKAGHTARETYAMPFDATDTRPRIGIVIDDLASSQTLTDEAIRSMPPAVTLSFMPYRHNLPALTAAAHAAGHEILLDLPMEPPDPQHHDPGPNALRIALDTPSNLSRLDWMMGRATGYVGLAAFLGGRFAAERSDLQPVLQEIETRGLLYVDNRAAAQSVAPAIAGEIGLPLGVVAVTLDTDAARNAVDQRLAELEQHAARDGRAIGMAAASESILQRVAAWSETLAGRKVVLAPISAVVVQPAPQAAPARPPPPPVIPAAPAAREPNH